MVHLAAMNFSDFFYTLLSLYIIVCAIAWKSALFRTFVSRLFLHDFHHKPWWFHVDLVHWLGLSPAFIIEVVMGARNGDVFWQGAYFRLCHPALFLSPCVSAQTLQRCQVQQGN